MFPRTKSLYQNTSYGSDWDQIWSREKKIASKKYFPRYFYYSIPKGDISDHEIETLFNYLDTKTDNEINEYLRSIVNQRNAEKFISQIRLFEEKIQPKRTKRLVLAMSAVADLFPDPEILFSFTTPFSQAAIVIYKLLKLISVQDGRLEVAKKILKETESIIFSAECYIWMRASKEDSEQERLFSTNEKIELRRIVADRIKQSAEEQSLYEHMPRHAARLFYSWRDCRNKDEVVNYLTASFDKDSTNIIKFLKVFLRKGWGMESGLPVPGRIKRGEYDSIKGIISPETIMEYLTKHFGEALNPSEFERDDNTSEDKRIANLFAYIHIKVKEQEEKKESDIDDAQIVEEEVK